MPVAHAKQIWPWLAARGARNWVLSNVFAGTISNSSLTYLGAAGRMGNGVPFNEAEMKGRFELAGRPLRRRRPDPAGPGCSRGRRYRGHARLDRSQVRNGVPWGVTVSFSQATVGSISAIPTRPADRKLDIKVKGDAQSVRLLSSYEPINGMRRLGFAPEDFSGQVEGRVLADIPLKKMRISRA